MTDAGAPSSLSASARRVEPAIRPVRVDDGPAIWRLVRDSGTLDRNSLYAYLLLCQQFGDTCLVAETAGEVAGFVVAFRPPRDPEAIFVWQIGVAVAARGSGLASALLDRLLRQPGCRGVTRLEATVTPSNEASRALFRSLARRLGARLEVASGFGPELFAGTDHEAEERYRIGPLDGGEGR